MASSYTRRVSTTFSPGFARDLLDLDAVGVVRQLQSQGHQTYFVGGCVRDMMLGRRPKDFDITTDARPEELKRIFGRRCRIIGRRFRLVHLHVGSQIYEIATFRGLPDDQELANDDSGFVVRANTFGTAYEDAKSRDFTVNGLFYDPVRDEVIDHVGGRDDVARRLLRTIGDADKRLREDPVRLLRAVKFAARLGFSLDQPILDAAHECSPLIATCPPPRVAEELYRIAESGYARVAFDWMHRLGVLDALLPEIARSFDTDAAERAHVLSWLGELDRLASAHGTLPREATFALMAWPFIENAIKRHPHPEKPSWGRFAMGSVRELAVRLSVPVRHRYSLAGMADQLKRLASQPPRRPTPGQLRSYGVPLALTATRMRFNMTGEGQEAYDLWAAELERLGLWAAPFEPRAEADPEDGGQPFAKDGPRLDEAPLAQRQRQPVTQFVARPQVGGAAQAQADRPPQGRRSQPAQPGPSSQPHPANQPARPPRGGPMKAEKPAMADASHELDALDEAELDEAGDGDENTVELTAENAGTAGPAKRKRRRRRRKSAAPPPA